MPKRKTRTIQPSPAPAPDAVPATLSEQKIEFTAEGSPPPGRVAGQGPKTVKPRRPTAARYP